MFKLAAAVLLVIGTIELANGQFRAPTRERQCNNRSWTHLRAMGFSDSACYWFSTEKANFIDAVKWCELIDGAHLVELPSMFANQMVLSLLQGANQGVLQKFWIGLTDMETEGVFKWYNAKRVAAYTYTNFKVAPTIDEYKNCVYVDTKGVWYVESCKAEFNFICEK